LISLGSKAGEFRTQSSHLKRPCLRKSSGEGERSQGPEKARGHDLPKRPRCDNSKLVGDAAPRRCFQQNAQGKKDSKLNDVHATQGRRRLDAVAFGVLLKKERIRKRQVGVVKAQKKKGKGNFKGGVRNE